MRRYPVWIIISALLLGNNAYGQSVSYQLVMTGSNRAIVIVEGNRMVLTAGASPIDGIQLKESDSERAVLLHNGKSITLRTDEIAAPVLQQSKGDSPENLSSSETRKIVLWANDQGFFFARGQVDGRSTRFLVDTGANTITFSSTQADQLGIEYRSGQNAFASTASGIAPIKTIILKSVTIEGIRLRNIQANVVLGNFPEVPLLGGSFLSKLKMTRSGNKMELSRY